VPSSPEDIEHYRPPPLQPEAKKRRVSPGVQSTISLPDDILTASVQRESEVPPPTKRRDTANKTDISYLKKVRERNKRAATKVRLKQRETEKSLASAEKELQEKNHSLTECVKELTHQVHDLKMQLLQHGTCDCTLIQEYIGNEANRYVQETSG
jgi:septin family protein